MHHWHRIFGTLTILPSPEAMLALVRRFFPAAELRLEMTGHGWQRAEFRLSPPLVLSLTRYLREEEGIRGELQAWATAVEEQVDTPAQEILLRQVATAQQIIALDPPESSVFPLAFALCRHLAAMMEGVFQIDGRGYFDAAGNTLLADES